MGLVNRLPTIMDVMMSDFPFSLLSFELVNSSRMLPLQVNVAEYRALGSLGRLWRSSIGYRKQDLSMYNLYESQALHEPEQTSGKHKGANMCDASTSA